MSTILLQSEVSAGLFLDTHLSCDSLYFLCFGLPTVTVVGNVCESVSRSAKKMRGPPTDT